MEQIVRLEVYRISLEIDKHIKPFQEIIAYHAVCILLTQHAGSEKGARAGHPNQDMRPDNHLVNTDVFQLAGSAVRPP